MGLAAATGWKEAGHACEHSPAGPEAAESSHGFLRLSEHTPELSPVPTVGEHRDPQSVARRGMAIGERGQAA